MEDHIVGASFYCSWGSASLVLTYNTVVNRHIRSKRVVFDYPCKLSAYVLLLYCQSLRWQESDVNVANIAHEDAIEKFSQAVWNVMRPAVRIIRNFSVVHALMCLHKKRPKLRRRENDGYSKAP
jgi:hypothetical protein